LLWSTQSRCRSVDPGLTGSDRRRSVATFWSAPVKGPVSARSRAGRSQPARALSGPGRTCDRFLLDTAGVNLGRPRSWRPGPRQDGHQTSSGKAKANCRMTGGQPNQAGFAVDFFRAYSGFGRLIHVRCRSSGSPGDDRRSRIVSPLPGCSRTLWSKLADSGRQLHRPDTGRRDRSART